LSKGAAAASTFSLSTCRTRFFVCIIIVFEFPELGSREKKRNFTNFTAFFFKETSFRIVVLLLVVVIFENRLFPEPWIP
jgi:hypothetical protein